MVNWARLAPGKSFSAHYHTDMQEVFLIVEGTARMVIDDQAIELGRGDAIAIQPQEVHQMWNDTEADIDYIVFGITNDSDGRTVSVNDT